MKIVYSIVLLLILGSCSQLSKVLKDPDVDRRYKAAMSFYEIEDYGKAGVIFEDLIPDIYGNPIAEKVQFYYAYCHFYQQQYDLAQHYFKTFNETYQRSPFAIEALYMHAYSLYMSTPEYNLDQSNTNEAILALQDFINRYPDNRYAEEANDCIKKLRANLEVKSFELAKQYQKRRHYKSAVIAFDSFRKAYPDSKYKEEALFLRLSSQSELARLSFDHLQLERYEELMTFYTQFIDRYPQSRFAREAETIYKVAQRKLEELKKAEAAAKKQ
jgi:outer membrane protein assembly factor BamD